MIPVTIVHHLRLLNDTNTHNAYSIRVAVFILIYNEDTRDTTWSFPIPKTPVYFSIFPAIFK